MYQSTQYVLDFFFGLFKYPIVTRADKNFDAAHLFSTNVPYFSDLTNVFFTVAQSKDRHQDLTKSVEHTLYFARL